MQRIAVAFAITAAGALALAEEAHEQDAGRLNVVVEAQTLDMELISPGANIVAFEYRPPSADGKRAVEEAIAGLEGAGGQTALELTASKTVLEL